MVAGFALWASGGVLILPLLSGGRAPAGMPALGLALSMLIWGLAIGILLPFVHRPLHESLETGSRHAEIGPNAAAGDDRPVRERKREHRG